MMHLKLPPNFHEQFSPNDSHKLPVFLCFHYLCWCFTEVGKDFLMLPMISVSAHKLLNTIHLVQEY